jgi:hypothetical protein
LWRVKRQAARALNLAAHFEGTIMETLIAQLVDLLESQPDSNPEGYDLESTTYSITVTILADLARANLLETV